MFAAVPVVSTLALAVPITEGQVAFAAGAGGATTHAPTATPSSAPCTSQRP